MPQFHRAGLVVLIGIRIIVLWNLDLAGLKIANQFLEWVRVAEFARRQRKLAAEAHVVGGLAATRQFGAIRLSLNSVIGIRYASSILFCSYWKS